ncbi:MAG: class 1 fructose-bisphosphatase [Deltaproteobacteria bacterium CG_4_8_14_3_um_filter_43_13]|nr:MAG: fructose-bisphosphatase [Deltaproteobacteria bacterium CG2_30_43_15]PIU86172.1 MAG: class 1 fructose-bisphosphatase [Deltaproteobacteria bacterium CG06_land_8_20_14_3_00_44_19]PIX26113.1 MAG: class 1 fructose-bisphosphatase [Deltaproteobacteria bacterium CG_4_8_14_3_um_filter_43_13]PIZ19681.1 MAG: class 1 fructose-bisphosphatase [Deltaproteobacteria bacterium CG_4_10_14_0_8_um_filter_43_12]HCX90897.1 class 1 fructose-bisphosphatase [Deltaproteobacteria bacterium]
MSKFGMTVTEHLLSQQRLHPDATGAFTVLLSELIVAAKIISKEARKSGLTDILGFTGDINVQGEAVKKLDEFANTSIIRRMSHLGQLCAMVSEESADIIEIPTKYQKGNYVLIFDPLDGSSNIDANVNIGTIFSIYKKVTPGGQVASVDVLQPGYRQVAAGYFLYGTSTMMVYTTGDGLHGFTLYPAVGEFLLSHENIRIPEKGSIFSVNMGYTNYWDENVKAVVDHFTKADPEKGLPYSLRYIGSLVADFHRTLLYGGIFMYPPDRKDPKKPHGKLRLTCECAPLAMLVKQAGGMATDGERDILEIEPGEIHQRVPLYIGSAKDVKTVMEILKTGRE